ncbi:MAG TPA: hypothetical protein VII58_09090 [Acidobacteriaceae bacterium]
MHEGKMWKRVLCGAALAAAMAVPAVGQVSFGIQLGRNPPPPLRYEARPPMPGPGFYWVDGYWRLDRGRYVWAPGVWQRPPYSGAYYTHGHWDHYPDGWRYHDGHWDREDHGDHYDWNRRDDGDRR